MSEPAMLKKVILIDDHSAVRGLVERFISSLGEYLVAAQFSVCQEIAESVAAQEPHLVIVDPLSCSEAGLDLVWQIRLASPSTRVIVFTGDCTSESIRKALEIGIQGYVCKTAQLSEFEQAIKAVSEGGIYFSSWVNTVIIDILQNKMSSDSKSPFPLSQRELGILRLMATGLSNKEIASNLGISPYTVANHRAKIRRKTGLKKAVQLSRYAEQIGLVTVPSAAPFGSSSLGVERPNTVPSFGSAPPVSNYARFPSP